MISVPISSEIDEEARNLAKQRNKKPAAYNKRFTKEYGDFEIHHMSLLAELAWEVLTGWEVDREPKWGDGGIDFVRNGRTYQLKTRNSERRPNPDLLCRLDYAKADRYILSEFKDNIVTFIGWCTKEELMQHTITIPGKGMRFVRKQSQLRAFPEELFNKEV